MYYMPAVPVLKGEVVSVDGSNVIIKIQSNEDLQVGDSVWLLNWSAQERYLRYQLEHMISREEVDKHEKETNKENPT